MQPTFRFFSVSILILTIFLSACASEPPAIVTEAAPPAQTQESLPADSAAPEPTNTPESADTPEPTNTPEPTEIPTNTSTPTSTPEPPAFLTDYIDGMVITREFNFDTRDGWWLWSGGSRIEDEQIVLVGENNWEGGLNSDKTFDVGEGIIISFENISGYNYLFRLDRGEWGTDSYRAFGILGGDAPKADLEQSSNYIGGPYLIGNLSIKQNHPYKLAIALGENGQFFAVIWDPESPDKKATYLETLGEKWIQNDWVFKIQTNTGTTLHIDDAQYFKFSTIQ